jgi:predicted CopG family antitoxin
VETKLRKKDTITTSLTWAFQEKDVTKLINALEREKSLLVLALSRDSGQLLHKIEACAEHHNAQLIDLLQTITIASENGKDSFSDVTSRLSDVQRQAAGLHNGIERLRNSGNTSEASKTRDTILRWLTSYDHASKHHAIIRNRQEGTGTWFLESDAYRAWLRSPVSQKILCAHLPGAGKTLPKVTPEVCGEEVDHCCHPAAAICLSRYEFLWIAIENCE